FYARWSSAGIRAEVAVRSAVPGAGSPLADLPGVWVRTAPLLPVFEGDTIEVELVLGARSARGPARLSGALAGAEMSAATGLVASLAAPRAGAGSELFGVREYRRGDSLRRIHWRSSARRGELVAREYEPPGLHLLGLFLDPRPASRQAADQVARLAASEAWD